MSISKCVAKAWLRHGHLALRLRKHIWEGKINQGQSWSGGNIGMSRRTIGLFALFSRMIPLRGTHSGKVGVVYLSGVTSDSDTTGTSFFFQVISVAPIDKSRRASRWHGGHTKQVSRIKIYEHALLMKGTAWFHSYRSASIGSRLAARIAGIIPLTRPVTTRIAVATSTEFGEIRK